jgi:hypothetical protein
MTSRNGLDQPAHVAFWSFSTDPAILAYWSMSASVTRDQAGQATGPAMSAMPR